MKEISVLNDIIPLGEFKAELSKWMKSMQQGGQPIIITQNGRPAGVLLSPKEFDELRRSKLFIDSVKRGVDDASSGKVFETPRLRQELQKRRQKRMTS